MTDLRRQVCHEMAGQGIIWWGNIVLYDLMQISIRLVQDAQRLLLTVLNAVNVAIHLALAPVILKEEN